MFPVERVFLLYLTTERSCLSHGESDLNLSPKFFLWIVVLSFSISESADNSVILGRPPDCNKSGRGRNYGGICKVVLHSYLRIDSLEEW